jgi:serine/threonine-protein kinase
MGVECPKCHFENPVDTSYCGKCGTKFDLSEEISHQPTETLETPREKLTTGATFAGRFQIIEELGKGGMGKVYRAVDEKLNEEVALKLIKPEIASDKKVIERFRNELKTARKIVHKNVGRMYELMEDEGAHYITMEYVPGEDLKSFIRRSGQLAVGTSLRIAKQVAEGLAEAHRLGVVHRDLKPSNVMIDKEGNARIMDFGIARSIRGLGLTREGVAVGTPAYMSPEQARGKDVDQRTDIWSLGVVLYEMSSGQLPFEGKNEQAVVHSILNDEPKPLSSLRSDIPKYIEQIVDKTLRKELDIRYQNVQELIQDLSKKLPAEAPKAKKSIAVLSFVNMSADPEQEYFCDGIAEELINALTQIRDLRVVARTSAFSFKGKDVDTEEIGKKLKVNHILEGSVRKAGERLRITAQLINVEDGYHLWSERYDRKMEDIFAIQDEVTLAIVDKTKLKLLGKEKEKLVKRYTEKSEAYNLYLKGRYFWNKRTGDGVKKAIEFFQEAIENDPSYAPAYSGLADCFNVMAFLGQSPPREAFPKAKAAALKALEIDSDLPEAHTSVGYISMIYDWDWETAERSFKRALELNPGYAVARQYFAAYLGIMGRFNECLSEVKQAVETDPLSVRLHAELGNYLYWAGRLDEALEQFQKTIEMDPNFGIVYGYMGLCYTEKKSYKKAIEALEKGVELMRGSPFFLGYLAINYAKTGKRDEAEEILHELERIFQKRYIHPVSIANLYAELGERDKAFEWMEKAYEEHDIFLSLFKTRREFKKLRSDPRAEVLLKKIGLSD